MSKIKLIEKLAEEGFSKKILSAFDLVRREDFVPAENRELAYEDIALPIGYGQTISQPSTIAFMLSLLEIEPDLKILEVGSGSGYAVAVMSALLDGDVYGVELVPELVESSKKLLSKYNNIKIFQAGKSLGLPTHAPFDRILVSASAKEIPDELVNQLSYDGIMVCPVRDNIVRIKKGEKGLTKEIFSGFVFVPLIEK